MPHSPSLHRFAAAFFLLAFALGCAGSRSADAPDPKPRREVLATWHDDARAGQEAAQDVAAQIGVIDDPALATWIGDLGRSLLRGVPRHGFEYAFHVVDMQEPNAFALPGGFIFVSRGLLALANSEDEVACVVGHEIVHAARRHAAAQQALSRSIGVFAMPWARAAQMASYSREMEREADEGGQLLCAAAGHDPLGLSTFLRTLEQFELLRRGASRGAGFFDSHPTSRERAASNAVRAGEIRWRRNPSHGDPRETYARLTEGLAVGQRPEVGVFDGDDFLHPSMGFAIRFPRGWTQVNTTQAVGAIEPRGEAVVFLAVDGPDRDPRAAAEAWLEKMREENRLDLVESKPVKVGGEDAWRMRLAARGASSYVTFIPFDDSIWRITGIARSVSAARNLGPTLLTSRSFHPIDEDERSRIRVSRLSWVDARAGEDLGALSRRTRNTWDVQMTAVYNGVFANHRFAGGERVKILRDEAWTPAPIAGGGAR
jgi:predicted Zn-dependent protease